VICGVSNGTSRKRQQSKNMLSQDELEKLIPTLGVEHDVPNSKSSGAGNPEIDGEKMSEPENSGGWSD